MSKTIEELTAEHPWAESWGRDVVQGSPGPQFMVCAWCGQKTYLRDIPAHSMCLSCRSSESYHSRMTRMKKHGPTSSTLILVRGLPGSGKSTFAASQCDYTHVEADMYHVIDGEYKFDLTRLRDAHAWCLREATSILADGGNVIVSNTFTRRGEMTKYIDAARSLSAKVIVIRMTGEYESIHNVPIDVIKKMSDRFEDFPGEIIAPNA